MPTSTFFHLPEEKRQRLLDAAWEEFSRTNFSNASINQIIHNARIPRGSFYQYFADKGDLFWYLLGEMHAYFANTFLNVLQDVGGDLFAVPVRVFDRFIGRRGSADPVLGRFIQVMRLNQGLDFQNFLTKRSGLLPEGFLRWVDLTKFRHKDAEFVENAFFLTVAPLVFAIMETLRDPEQWERQRAILRTRVEIVRLGSIYCAECAEEEIDVFTLEGGD